MKALLQRADLFIFGGIMHSASRIPISGRVFLNFRIARAPQAGQGQYLASQTSIFNEILQ